VRLRVCDKADGPAVHDVIHRTIDECYPPVYPPRAIAFFKRFHSPQAIAQRLELGHVLVVEDEGQVVATGSLVGDEITAVFVTPRAQRTGLGGLVMDRLEALAASVGSRSVRLSVSLPSRAFYERRGYQVVEERSLDVGEGEYLDYWDAEKSLVGESWPRRVS
jgi:GNAT superfamily N-acetyltransferase